MNGETSLQELIELSIARDTHAFERLVGMLDRKLFGFLCSRTRSRDEALDSLQETFVALWVALARFTYRSDEGFYRFLYTTAKRKLPRRNPLQSVLLGDAPEIPDESFARAATVKGDVGSALLRLDDAARDIVTLHHWSGFTFKEIGAMLVMSEGAVRVRHHRALEKMRSALTAYA